MGAAVASGYVNAQEGRIAQYLWNLYVDKKEHPRSALEALDGLWHGQSRKK
jgi:hypothetical protein